MYFALCIMCIPSVCIRVREIGRLRPGLRQTTLHATQFVSMPCQYSYSSFLTVTLAATSLHPSDNVRVPIIGSLESILPIIGTLTLSDGCSDIAARVTVHTYKLGCSTMSQLCVARKSSL